MVYDKKMATPFEESPSFMNLDNFLFFIYYSQKTLFYNLNTTKSYSFSLNKQSFFTLFPNTLFS